MMDKVMGINPEGGTCIDTYDEYVCKSYTACASDYRYYYYETDAYSGTVCSSGWSSRGCCPY